jgi:tripartite-type tricarboxylate transporter receptor subunit TctC
MLKNTIRTAACLALAALTSQQAMADQFPSQPIKIVLGFGVGGGADAVARLYALKLGQLLNTSVIVENKAGAYEQIAGQAVASAKADGYTLWLSTTGGVVQAPLLKKLPYDPKELTHIGVIAEADAVLAVKNGFSARNVAELVQYAKKNPGAINFGSAGTGAPSHLLMEYVQAVTNTKMTHIPFKSAGDVVRELTGGTIDIAIAVPASAVPLIQGGKFRAIAVTAPTRIKALPDVPTLEEGGVKELKDMSVYAFYGILGPAGMPAETVKILNDAFTKISRDPEVQQKAESMNFRTVWGTSAEFSARMVRESKQWTQIAEKIR